MQKKWKGEIHLIPMPVKAAGLALTDVVQFGQLPPGFIVTKAYYKSEAFDGDGELDIGIAGTVAGLVEDVDDTTTVKNGQGSLLATFGTEGGLTAVEQNLVWSVPDDVNSASRSIIGTVKTDTIAELEGVLFIEGVQG